jgi:hypothetical protein
MPDALKIERKRLPTSDTHEALQAAEAGERRAAGSAAIEGKARHAIAAACNGSRNWITAHPGTSLILALCGGATLGWLMKRR